MDKRMTSSGSDVWVFSERMDVTLELLGKGRELADGLGASLCALILGTALEHEADTFASHGADKVFLVESQALQNTLPEPFAEALGKLASQYGPEILLIGSTRRGKDIAARVAARLETGVITDCVALGLDEEKRMLVADRPSYGGILVSTEICTTRPQIATVPPRAFEPAAPRQGQRGEVIRTDVDLAPPKTRVVQVASKEVRGVRLEDAKRDCISRKGRSEEGGPQDTPRARQRTGRRGRMLIATGRGPEVAAAGAPCGPHGPEGQTQAVRGVRDIGSGPAHHRHERFAHSRGHKHRPRGTHLPAIGLLREGRPVRDSSPADRSVSEDPSEVISGGRPCPL